MELLVVVCGDLADVVARLLPEDHEVARVVAGEHADAVGDDVGHPPAELLGKDARPQGDEGDHDRERRLRQQV